MAYRLWQQDCIYVPKNPVNYIIIVSLFRIVIK